MDETRNSTRTGGSGHVIAVGNQKGGVTKTSTAVHLGNALADIGRRVLIWDLDPAARASVHFGIPKENKYPGSFDVLVGQKPVEEAILTGDDPVESLNLPKNLHLIPAHRNLESVEAVLRQRNKFVNPRDVMKPAISDLRHEYDYIFLDTAPNAGFCTIGAYLTAPWFILTAIPEHFAIDGLNDAIADIKNAQSNGNQNVRLLGIVLCQVNQRYRSAQVISDVIRQTFTPKGGQSLKFATEISRTVRVPEAQAVGKTLFQTDPSHKVCDEYRQLARELEQRIKDFSQAKEAAGLEIRVADHVTQQPVEERAVSNV